MDNQSKVALASAVVGGYVLGRTKKGRLALSVATYLAGRRFALEPRQMAAQGLRKLGEMPQFAPLQEQLREEVLGAGRQAVTAGANRSLYSLADAIGERTARLSGAPEPDEEPEEDDQPEDEGEEDEEADEPAAPAEEPAPAKKSPSGKKAAAPKKAADKPKKAAAKKAAAPKQKPTAEKTAPAGKSTTKTSAGKKSAASKKKSTTKKSAAKKATPAKRATSKRADRRR
ncbi:hypothetical protein DSC45_13515 [Streptomyces sp. YIM 130001]|uniref:histone protein n=1 Tax=Streptomyces sp. YIM 130001 TaxID=2259644 RepID=UPI000E65B421|nr:histone protein [Streptomyces sp. YIM 130001]RII17917.1 hypothetical protein DSC45_13515 [Streptomyces sp. YIM 130001]